MTKCAIAFPLKTVYCSIEQEMLYLEGFHFLQSNQHEYYEGLRYGDNRGHFIMIDE